MIVLQNNTFRGDRFFKTEIQKGHEERLFLFLDLTFDFDVRSRQSGNQSLSIYRQFQYHVYRFMPVNAGSESAFLPQKTYILS